MILKKIIAIILCVSVISLGLNSNYKEAKAEAFTLTMVTAAGGGALGAVAPLLLAVAIGYAGYKIIKNREKIVNVFKGWISKSSVAVKGWIDDISSAINSGDITDGDTIQIDKDVLEETRIFVNNYVVTYGGGSGIIPISADVIYLSDLAEYIDNQLLKEEIMESTLSTTSPVVIFRKLDGTHEQIIFGQNSSIESLAMNVYGSTVAFYQIGRSWIFDNSVLAPSGNLGNVRFIQWDATSGLYTSSETGSTSVGIVKGSDTVITIDDGWIKGIEGWGWEGQIIMPMNSTIVYTDIMSGGYPAMQLGVNTSIIADSYDGVDEYIDSDYIYNPQYVGEDDEYINVELTPEMIGKWHDYLVEQGISEMDLVNVLDPTGVIEREQDNEGIIDGILDGIKDIFEWLVVPSELAIDDAIAHCQETMDNQAGLLTYPLTLVIEFLLAVADLDTDSDVILQIPEIKYKQHVLYSGLLFDVKEFINDYNLGNVQNIIYAIGNFIMIIGLLNLAKRKGDEIIRGI